MTVGLREQVRDHYRSIDQIQEPVDQQEILERLAMRAEAPLTAATTRTRRARVVLVVLAAVTVIALMVLPSIIGGPTEVVDTVPVTTVPPATTIPPESPDESLTQPPLVVAVGPPVARVSPEISPLGEPVIHAGGSESSYTPIGSNWEEGWTVGRSLARPGIVEFGGGFAAVGGHIAGEERTLITSEDGLIWNRLETSGLEDITGRPILFDAGGRYWIASSSETDPMASSALYVSDDMVSWDQVDIPQMNGPISAWVEYEDQLVAFGRTGAAVVEIRSANADPFDVPWSERWVSGLYVDSGGLEVIATAFGSESGSALMEQYSTEDLVAWSDPRAPAVLGDAIEVVDGIRGDEVLPTRVEAAGNAGSGYLATIYYDGVDSLGYPTAVSYMSADGSHWSVVANPNPSPEAPVANHIVVARFGEGLALVSQVENLGRPHSIVVSSDGLNWQEITLTITPSPGIDEPPGAGVSDSLAVVGSRILMYDNVQGWLNSWVIEFPG